MNKYISLLRGINVGGRKRFKMADLRDLYQSLGLQDTRTLLQSGNAAFVTAERDIAGIQGTIEAGIASTYGFEVRIILRQADAFKLTFDRHPVSADMLREPAKLAAVFLSEAPSAAALSALIASAPGRETVIAGEAELYIHYPDGMARSKLNNAFIERKLGLIATARNWNTCQRILQLLAEYED